MRAVALVLAFIAGPAFGEAASPFVEGLLWRISKSGIPDSYAFGTIHVADPRVAVSKPVADALARSGTLALELIEAVADQRVFELEQLTDGSRLKALVGDAAFAQVSAELVAQGIPQDVIARMKPWAAMMKIARASPRGNEASIDHQLLQAARARGLKLELLELVDEQIAAFDAVPLGTQVALLKHVLAERPALEADVERTIQAWLRGDLAQLARLNAGPNDRFPEMSRHYQVLTGHIIHDRNVLMHHRLFMPLRAGRVFIAVGAMHLHGDKGLLALIAQDGYRVVRLRQ
jgi:uncharacterized protein YbaP (TraB family)